MNLTNKVNNLMPKLGCATLVWGLVLVSGCYSSNSKEVELPDYKIIRKYCSADRLTEKIISVGGKKVRTILPIGFDENGTPIGELHCFYIYDENGNVNGTQTLVIGNMELVQRTKIENNKKGIMLIETYSFPKNKDCDYIIVKRRKSLEGELTEPKTYVIPTNGDLYEFNSSSIDD